MRVTVSLPLRRFTGVLSWDAATLERLVDAAVRAATGVGLRLDDDHDGARLEEAACAGADVDRGERLVRFTERDIRDTIAAMRSTVAVPPSGEAGGTSTGEDGARAAGRDATYLAGNGAQLVFDGARWAARTANADDLREACRRAQGSDLIGTLFPPFLVSGADARLEPLWSYAILAAHCGKRILHGQPTDPFHVRWLDRMESAVRADRGHHQPMQEWEYLNPPFRLARRAIDTMLARVDSGCCGVMGIGSMAVAGLSAPVTAAGLAVAAVGEVLAGLAFLHRLRPHAGLRGMVAAGSLDLRSGRVSYGSVHTHLCNLAAWELLTRGIGAGATCPTWYRDANEPGLQALHEFSMNQAFFSSVLGRSIPEIGGLASGALFSAEQAVMDIEAAREFDELAHGFVVDEEAVGLEEVLAGRFAPDHHVATEHTVRHRLDGVPYSSFYPRGLGATSRHDARTTQTAGLMAEAARKAREATERGRSQAPEQRLANELQRLVEEAAREIGVAAPPPP